MSDSAVFRAQGLQKAFSSREGTISVLEGIDLSVRRGEVVGIVGASGVGKSTLLHIMGSLDHPDAGQVSVGGRNLDGLKGAALNELRNKVIGFVFQFHFLLPDFTARENVMMPLLIAGVSQGEAERQADYWLDKVGLSDRVSHRPGELSGGEQQRVAVARALVNRPDVVLADEPTGNLDDHTAEEVHGLIRALADDEGITFIVVTHKRGFSRYADRVLTLAGGTLQETG